jgi:GntR family transcriptional regulator
MDEAEVLRIAPGASLFELSRLRFLDGAAIALDHNRTPLRLMPRAAEIDFTTASFYGSLVAAGHPPVQASLQIEARLATEQEGQLLDLPPPAPVLVANERTTDQNGQAIMLGISIFRSDRHRLLANYTLSVALEPRR